MRTSMCVCKYFFLPQLVFLATFNCPDVSMALTRPMATFCGPDLSYIICGNGHSLRQFLIPVYCYDIRSVLKCTPHENTARVFLTCQVRNTKILTSER